MKIICLKIVPCYYYYSLRHFPARVFHRNLIGTKSSRVSRTLLRILTYLSNPVIWTVSLCYLNFQIYFQLLTMLHRGFTQNLGWVKLATKGIQCFIHNFGCYFSNQSSSTFQKRSAVQQSAVFVIHSDRDCQESRKLVYKSLTWSTQGYPYHWLGGSFTVPQFSYFFLTRSLY